MMLNIDSIIENLGLQCQVRDHQLCSNPMPWNTGIMECWNIGFGGMRSTFI